MLVDHRSSDITTSCSHIFCLANVNSQTLGNSPCLSLNIHIVCVYLPFKKLTSGCPITSFHVPPAKGPFCNSVVSKRVLGKRITAAWGSHDIASTFTIPLMPSNDSAQYQHGTVWLYAFAERHLKPVLSGIQVVPVGSRIHQNVKSLDVPGQTTDKASRLAF